MTNIFTFSHVHTYTCRYPLLFDMWVDTEWLGNEAHSLWVNDLTGKGGGCLEKTRGERKAGILAKTEDGFLSFFHHSSLFICHLLCAPCQQLKCCMDTGESGGKEQREKMFKCWWQPLVAAGTEVSALILPQHASDRQMIEKEPGRRREEKRPGGAAFCACDVVCFEDQTSASITKNEALWDGWGCYFIDHISKLFPLSSPHPFLSLWPLSLFTDRLSYTAPSLTGIPSCFHSDKVRGGRSLLAVVCNHHRSCSVFVGPLPPPPLLTSPTLLCAAERDPWEPKGLDSIDPEVRGVYRVLAGVFVCVLQLGVIIKKSRQIRVWLKTNCKKLTIFFSDNHPVTSHSHTQLPLHPLCCFLNILYLFSPVCPHCQFVVFWCFTTALTAVDQSVCLCASVCVHTRVCMSACMPNVQLCACLHMCVCEC